LWEGGSQWREVGSGGDPGEDSPSCQAQPHLLRDSSREAEAPHQFGEASCSFEGHEKERSV